MSARETPSEGTTVMACSTPNWGNKGHLHDGAQKGLVFHPVGLKCPSGAAELRYGVAFELTHWRASKTLQFVENSLVRCACVCVCQDYLLDCLFVSKIVPLKSVFIGSSITLIFQQRHWWPTQPSASCVPPLLPSCSKIQVVSLGWKPSLTL